MTGQRSDAEIAVAAARAGAEVVRAAYGGALTRTAKAGLDFATDADFAAERAILAVLRRERPDDRVVGEETGDSGGNSSRRWLVDPLCGTLNFGAETPLVAVNVALLDGDRRLASAVADPISGEVFSTDAPLAASAASGLVDVNCDGPLDRPFVGPQLLADPAFRAEFGPRVLSSTLALAWVAAGRRAAYVTDGRFEDNVHFAAGIGLCVAAGCVVSDLAGAPLGTGRGLVAGADAATHDRLVAIIRPHLDAVAATPR